MSTFLTVHLASGRPTGSYPETGFEEIGPLGTVTRFSFGDERVGGGGNSLFSTDVLGQSNG
ncbi:MAG: hypothetical protein WA299_19215, partial [Candidatus Acidiferrum sp.]